MITFFWDLSTRSDVQKVAWTFWKMACPSPVTIRFLKPIVLVTQSTATSHLNQGPRGPWCYRTLPNVALCNNFVSSCSRTSRWTKKQPTGKRTEWHQQWCWVLLHIQHTGVTLVVSLNTAWTTQIMRGLNYLLSIRLPLTRTELALPWSTLMCVVTHAQNAEHNGGNQKPANESFTWTATRIIVTSR